MSDGASDASTADEIDDSNRAVELAEIDDGLPLASTDPDDRVGMYDDMPREAVDLVNRLAAERDEPRWKVLTQLIFEGAGGGMIVTVPQYEREIEREQRAIGRVDEQIEQHKAKIRELENERIDHEQRIESLKDGMERRKEQTRSLRDTLDGILDDMVEKGQHAAIDVGRIPMLADKWFGGDQRVALDALQARADKTDREIPDQQFSAPGSASTPNQNPARDADLKSLKRLQGEAETDGGDSS